MWNVSTGSGTDPSHTETAGPSSTSRAPPTTDSPTQPITWAGDATAWTASSASRAHAAWWGDANTSARIAGSPSSDSSAAPAASAAAARVSSAVESPAPVFIRPSVRSAHGPARRPGKRRPERPRHTSRAADQRPGGRVLLPAPRSGHRRPLHPLRQAHLHRLHAAGGSRIPVPRLRSGSRQEPSPLATGPGHRQSRAGHARPGGVEPGRVRPGTRHRRTARTRPQQLGQQQSRDVGRSAAAGDRLPR